ncbi:MAG: hypothetical protein QOJ42_7225 [Acidobacteriaceae bacterium]|nr:hypothetical protein [Acidobacteriaceae bacterium]
MSTFSSPIPVVFFLAACSGVLQAQTPVVTLSGPSQIRFGGTGQYSALVNGVPGAVVWSANGVAGGTNATGPISAFGFYTPAANFFAGHSVTISAATVAQPAGSASLSVKILNPLPTITAGSVTQTAPGTSFALTLNGTGFVSGSQLQVAGVNTATTYLSTTGLQSSISVPAGTTSITVGVLNPNAAQKAAVTQTIAVQTIPPVSLAAATRLVDQTTFGPTLSAVQNVQQLGVAAYLAQQFATPTTRMPAIPNPPVAICPNGTHACAQSAFWKNALTANDQLRQRVAFALSEIFVVSTAMVNARTIPSYHNLLADDAFGNFRQLLNDVTTSPAMGAYLNMLNSNAAPAGQIANENYARELMQLFTTGLYRLNPDGSLQLDGQGMAQPVYTQAQVQAYARALTGWTYANATGGVPTSFPNGVPNFDQPMRAIEVAHDMSAKALLSGATLPAGQTAEQDLSGVIDSIFNHPNVGPFVGRQLIQHLVTGNPSPAYVGRVAAAFANNGSGVRGDMKAVITAILKDPEARAADSDPAAEEGHLREPILYFTGILRALQFTNIDPQGRYDVASNYTAPLGEVPYGAASVFNFFPPSYVIPGAAINAPEFAQENTAAATLRMTLADSIVRNHLTSFFIDMGATSFLGQIASATGNPATDSANLVTALNILFTHAQMAPTMQSAIAANAALLPDIGQRVRVSTWLVISSNFYKIAQ